MRYTVRIKSKALKFLNGLEDTAARRLRDRIASLAEDPRGRGTVALQGRPGLLRLRIGNYRVVYTVEDGALLVLVVDIGHRREVYR